MSSTRAGLTDAPAVGDALSAAASAVGARREPVSASRERSNDFAQSLEHGLAVIRAFCPDRPRLTLSEAVRHTRLTRATARRLLLTLVELRYVHFDRRLFSLRPQVLELGYSYISTPSMPEFALPYLEELAGQVAASVAVAVLDGEEIFCVAHLPARRMLAVRIPVGTRLPTHASAMGHVLVAGLSAADRRAYLASARLERLTPVTPAALHELATVLDAAYRNGFALGDEGLEENLHAVAVPVTDGRGGVVAALGVVTQRGSPAPERLRAGFLAPLLQAAEQMSGQLRRLSVPASR